MVVGLVAPSSARARGVDLAIGRAQVVRLSPEWHDRPDVSRSSILGVALLALSSGCYQSHGLEPGEADAGAPMAMDAGRPWRDTDAGPPVDASVPRWDAAVVDAGALDAGVFDADAFDAAPLDAALLDASRQDGGRSDGGLDAGWDAGPDATVWLDGGVCGPGTDAGVAASPHTIDRYELRADATYRLAGMAIFPYRATHYLSDGTSWSSGAGSTRMGTARVVRIERVGTSIRYQLRPEERLLERTDYDGGDHSAHHGLDAVSELVLVAEYGGTSARSTVKCASPSMSPRSTATSASITCRRRCAPSSRSARPTPCRRRRPASPRRSLTGTSITKDKQRWTSGRRGSDMARDDEELARLRQLEAEVEAAYDAV
ncbi:MAG: hypothetical protein M5U28_37345 [Sandaracinaceae bacterium]|nr:hypothetical protein [Sandaracinaceae bacterium]